MLTLIFNNDFSNALLSTNFSQSTVFQIDHYSTHQTTMNFNIQASSVEKLINLENTKLTSLRVQDENSNNIAYFTFDVGNLYILSYNTSIYDGGQTTNVNVGEVPIPQQSEPEGEGE